MKKITLLLLTLFTASLGYAQTELLNLSFDAAGSESIWTPIADAAAQPAEVTIAYNANGNGTGATELSGVNTSAGAGRAYIFRYDNTGFDFGTSGSLSISLDVKIDQALQGTNLVFQTQVSKVGGGVVVATHDNLQNSVAVGASWVTLTFDMTPNPAEFNNAGNELSLFFNMAAGAFVGAGGTIFVDNIVVIGTTLAAPTCTDGIENGDETGVDCGGSCPNACVIPAPLVSAPLSTTPESDVLFLYSDVYTTPANQVAFNNANWMNPAGPVYGASTEEVITGTSDNVRYITDLTVGFAGITQTDFSDYDYFHIDIWSDESTFIIVKWEGAGAGLSGQESVALTPNEWTSVDIDLNTYGSLASDRTTLFQMVFDATAGKDYYFDNVYFSKTSFVLGTEDLELASFSAYPNPTQDSWTVRTENSNMSSINVFDILGKNVLSLTPNASETVINGSTLKSGLYFAQIKTDGGVSSLKLVKN